MATRDAKQTEEATMSDQAEARREDGGPYAALRAVLDEAYAQSAHGKGKARHANDRPFEQQPILEIGRMVGPGFALGQVMKKAQEARGMLDRDEVDAASAELLGAIVYAASVVVLAREGGAARGAALAQAERRPGGNAAAERDALARGALNPNDTHPAPGMSPSVQASASNKLQIEAGKRYLTRCGEVIGPMRLDLRNTPYDWTDGGDCWRPNGRYMDLNYGPCSQDLIAEALAPDTP